MPVSVAWATANGSAVAPGDYQAASGTLTFAPGVTTQTVVLSVVADLRDEPDETFYVNLTNPAGARLGTAHGIITIIDDDPTPDLAIDDVSLREGASGTINAVFTVSLSAASGRQISINYDTSNGSTTAGSDYTAMSGTLTFTPGTLTQTIAVPVTGDLLNEADETFFIDLGNPTNAGISRSRGIATIVNDDPVPGLSIADVTSVEGDSGTKTFSFSVKLTAASGRTVTVAYTTADGTAAAGGDYVAKSRHTYLRTR